MFAALDLLPDLSDDYSLVEEQIRSFRENGHVLLRGVASPKEVAAYRKVITDATLRYNTERRPLEERDTYGKAFLQITNLWTRDAAVKRFVLARRFAKIAADLMGVEDVQLLKLLKWIESRLTLLSASITMASVNISKRNIALISFNWLRGRGCEMKPCKRVSSHWCSSQGERSRFERQHPAISPLKTALTNPTNGKSPAKEHLSGMFNKLMREATP